MGCSPPDSWYDDNERKNRELVEAENQHKINELLDLVCRMTPEERLIFKRALGLDTSRILFG